MAEFKSYGITTKFPDKSLVNIEAIWRLLVNKDLLKNTNDCVIEKKPIRSDLTVKLRYFGHHFREPFGKESTAYLIIDIRNLNNVREKTAAGIASMTAFGVHRCFAELSANDTTDQEVTALDDCAGGSITALNAAEAAGTARTSATAATIAVANAEFAAHTKVCRAGKQKFSNTSAARKEECAIRSIA